MTARRDFLKHLGFVTAQPTTTSKIEPVMTQEELKPDEIIDELLKRYPSGFVGGSVTGIVRQGGMSIEWINPDLTKEQYSLRENDQVSITFVRGKSLEISCSGKIMSAIVSPLFFKKFVVG